VDKEQDRPDFRLAADSAIAILRENFDTHIILATVYDEGLEATHIIHDSGGNLMANWAMATKWLEKQDGIHL